MEHAEKRLTVRLVALAVGMFAVGTDSFVLAGVLPGIAGSLHVDLATSADLITAYALAYAILSPVVAALAARVPRKSLLVAGMIVFAGGNVGTALASTYGLALTFRVVAALGWAMFTPTAAAMVVGIAPPEKRATALSVLFGGLSVATALGSPIGTAISGYAGWRGTMLFVAAIGLLAALAVVVGAPSVPVPPAVGLKQRLSPLSDPRIVLTLVLPAVLNCGLFTLYTYVSRVFAPATGGNTTMLAWLLFAWGISAVVGNLASGRLTDRFGNRVVINSAGLIAALVFATSPWSSEHQITTFVAAMIWGACGWALIVPVQHRLVEVNPDAAQFSISLSSSATYLGVSMAPLLGGFILGHGVSPNHLGYPAAGVIVIGLAIGESGCLLARRNRQKVQAADPVDSGTPALSATRPIR